jgi:hypothetical protein
MRKKVWSTSLAICSLSCVSVVKERNLADIEGCKFKMNQTLDFNRQILYISSFPRYFGPRELYFFYKRSAVV